jgi:hypothetical protein
MTAAALMPVQLFSSTTVPRVSWHSRGAQQIFICRNHRNFSVSFFAVLIFFMRCTCIMLTPRAAKGAKYEAAVLVAGCPPAAFAPSKPLHTTELFHSGSFTKLDQALPLCPVVNPETTPLAIPSPFGRLGIFLRVHTCQNVYGTCKSQTSRFKIVSSQHRQPGTGCKQRLQALRSPSAAAPCVISHLYHTHT